jgi:hypothetical protein
VRRQTGRKSSVLGLVLDRARCGEAERTGTQRILEQTTHRFDLGYCWVLCMIGAALAHYVEAQRAVRDLRADVHHLRRGRQRVEILGERFPIERDALGKNCPRDVFYAFHQVDQIGRGTFAHRCEADAAVAEYNCGDAMQ